MPAREPDSDAFALGVIHAKRGGDLRHHLFAVRTLGQFDVLSRGHAARAHAEVAAAHGCYRLASLAEVIPRS